MMSKYLNLCIIGVCVVISNISINAQSTPPCGHDIVTKQWWDKNPKSKEDYYRTVQKIQASIKSTSKVHNSGIRNQRMSIPVVFHVLHLNGPENISDEQIHDQIRILNRDYQKQNEDTSRVVDVFKNNIANVDFEFHLARIDPYGNCTDGIVRHYTPKTVWNSSRLEDFTYTWPAEKYLNIYVVKKIDIAPAYTFLPGVGIPAYADAVVCESWLVGSIGTATSQNTRVLTHEVGHWFGLPHIWGVSNAPGVECGDDFVEDTPITKGFTTCSINNAKICNPDIHENVQNYMDYSPCKLMFTNGQAAYMRETISLGLNKRDHLVSDSNLIATGVIGEVSCAIKADFFSIYNSICKGDSIKFYSQSKTGDKNGYITWFFEGGIPAVSSDSIVDVTYVEAGEYKVTLTISGQNGTDSLTKFIKVYDGYGGQKTPHFYNFDDGIIPSEIQFFKNDPNGFGWQILENIGANDTGGCLYLDNASTNSKGRNAYFETPFFDFSDNSKPSMSFYYAYAKNSEAQVDSFRLEYTLDCGKTWRVFPGMPGTNTMANLTGGVNSSAFFPNGPDQWRKLTLSNTFQALFKNKSNVKFRFYFGADSSIDGTNNFFIDEINIKNESITAIQEQAIENIIIYPNPSTSTITVEILGTNRDNYVTELSNVTGQNLDEIRLISVSDGKMRFTINDTHQLSAGLYFVKIKKSGFPEIVKKIVILN